MNRKVYLTDLHHSPSPNHILFQLGQCPVNNPANFMMIDPGI